MTLDDAILAATGGPTVTDGLLAWYQANGAVSDCLPDAERQFLRIQMPAAEGTTQDLWMEYLDGLPFTGSLSDRLLQYWTFQAGPAGPIPVNTTAPVVTGTPQSGNALSCSTGVWTDAEGYSYRWLDSGTPIIGETQSSLSLNSSYLGKDISCRVTASNSVGSASVDSNAVTILP